MTRIFLILFLMFSFSSQSQENEKITIEKNKIIETLKTINLLYAKKDSNLKIYFADKVQCVICKYGEYENEYQIKNNEFITKCLKNVIEFINYKKIKRIKTSLFYDKSLKVYSLSYETAKPNEKTNFEGASAIINFKKVNGVYKICSIQTIP